MSLTTPSQAGATSRTGEPPRRAVPPVACHVSPISAIHDRHFTTFISFLSQQTGLTAPVRAFIFTRSPLAKPWEQVEQAFPQIDSILQNKSLECLRDETKKATAKILIKKINIYREDSRWSQIVKELTDALSSESKSSSSDAPPTAQTQLATRLLITRIQNSKNFYLESLLSFIDAKSIISEDSILFQLLNTTELFPREVNTVDGAIEGSDEIPGSENLRVVVNKIFNSSRPAQPVPASSSSSAAAAAVTPSSANTDEEEIEKVFKAKQDCLIHAIQRWRKELETNRKLLTEFQALEVLRPPEFSARFLAWTEQQSDLSTQKNVHSTRVKFFPSLLEGLKQFLTSDGYTRTSNYTGSKATQAKQKLAEKEHKLSDYITSHFGDLRGQIMADIHRNIGEFKVEYERLSKQIGYAKQMLEYTQQEPSDSPKYDKKDLFDWKALYRALTPRDLYKLTMPRYILKQDAKAPPAQPNEYSFTMHGNRQVIRIDTNLNPSIYEGNPTIVDHSFVGDQLTLLALKVLQQFRYSPNVIPATRVFRQPPQLDTPGAGSSGAGSKTVSSSSAAAAAAPLVEQPASSGAGSNTVSSSSAAAAAAPLVEQPASSGAGSKTVSSSSSAAAAAAPLVEQPASSGAGRKTVSSSSAAAFVLEPIDHNTPLDTLIEQSLECLRTLLQFHKTVIEPTLEEA